MVIAAATGADAGFLIDFSLGVKADETNATPTEAQALALAAQFDEDLVDQAAIAFRSQTNNANTSSSGSVSLNKPTGTVDGDMMLTYIALGAVSGALVITPPAGWTALEAANTVVDTILSTTLTYQVFQKIASGEPASWTWSWSPNADTRACAVLTFVGGQVVTDIKSTNGGNGNRQTVQDYGPVVKDTTSRKLEVGMVSLARVHANAGWATGPVNLTDRTGDVCAAGTNSVDLQVWGGLGGSKQGNPTHNESDVWLSMACVVQQADNPMSETVKAGISGSGVNDSNATPSEAIHATFAWPANGSFSFTIPTGTTSMDVKAWGSGAGGGGGALAGSGSGGGGGAEAAATTVAVTAGDVISIVVGAGGAAGAANASGSDGNKSTVKRGATTFADAGGGIKGLVGTALGAAGGAGGAVNTGTGNVGGAGGTGGAALLGGGGGGGGGADVSAAGGAGGAGTLGAGAAGAGTAPSGGNGGAGGAAPTGGVGVAGVKAGGAGGGGGASATSPGAGGAGADGRVEISI